MSRPRRKGLTSWLCDCGQEGSGTVEISSSVDLVAYEDPDDGVRITVGESVMGVVDYPSDADAFSIALSEGETVAITVDAVLVDARVLVDFDGSTRVQGMADDDSGGGLFGTNARIVYRAPHEGEYFIRVRDARDSNVGGYILTVTAGATRRRGRIAARRGKGRQPLWLDDRVRERTVRFLDPTSSRLDAPGSG